MSDKSEQPKTVDELEKEIEELQSELKEVKDEMADLIYVVSHDLQEPLRMVGSYTGLIERRYGEAIGEGGKDFIHFAQDGVKRMTGMIESLLELSRVETRKAEDSVFSIEEIIDKVKKALTSQIEATKAIINLNSSENIKGDKNQIFTLLHNIIDNAIKFKSEEPPKVDIHCKVDGDFLEIKISDNGKGLQKEFYDRIFKIFQRLHTRDQYPGKGAGLAIAKRITQAHNGSIKVKSETNKGSEFTIRLPKAD